MKGIGRFTYKVQLLTNLSILIWFNIVRATSSAFHNALARLLLQVAPNIAGTDSVLASTYETVRKRLKDSLKEIEDKTQRLEETGEELRKSRDLLRTIIDSIGSDLIVIDRDFRIIQANRSVRERSDKQEIIGHRCYEVTHRQEHPCQSFDCICPVSKVWETGEPFQVVHMHPVIGGAQNEYRYFQVVASPLTSKDGIVNEVVELHYDITKDKEQESRILEMNRTLRALNAVAITISKPLSLEHILNTALDWVLDTVEMSVGGILLLDEKAQILSYRASRGFSKQYVEGANDTNVGEGVAGTVASDGIPIVVDDASQDSHMLQHPIVVQEGVRGLLSVPLKAKERVVGVLITGNHTPRSFSTDEIQLITALGHQLGIAIENAQLYLDIQQKEQVRAELLRQVIKTQEDERRRVARELHDVTSQALATLAVRVETLNSKVVSNPVEIDSTIDEIKRLISFTNKEVHNLIYDLRPTLLDDLGLVAAVRSCACNVLNPAGIETHVESVGVEERLPPEVEIAAFRITQEAITNIASHSRAESAYVSIEFKDNSIVVQVEDDGVGFNLTKTLSSARARENMGLLGMKERAELLSGTLNIDTQLGKGTRITIEIPYNRELADAENKNNGSG